LEAVALGPADHHRCRPTDEAFDGTTQFGAPLREAIHDVPIIVGQTAFDHPGCSQVAEPVCEQVRRDTGKALGELSVPCGSDQELANDEQIPPVADDIKRPGQSTILAVAPTHLTIRLISQPHLLISSIIVEEGF
jgi:hypothetical protein